MTVPAKTGTAWAKDRAMAIGARSLALLEVLVGQLYPTIVIARLVSRQWNGR